MKILKPLVTGITLISLIVITYSSFGNNPVIAEFLKILGVLFLVGLYWAVLSGELGK